MKKTLCCLLAIAVLAAMTAGCSGKTEQGVFKAKNEIFTYEKIDPEKTQIVVSRTGNLNVEGLCNEFEELNPDVQVIYLDITGGNSGYAPLKEWVTRGLAPDVVISAGAFFDEELTIQHFEDLSGDPIIQNYEMAALQRTATENSIYWLPGPAEIAAMMYNKTLFEQYGWQVPTTFDEFIALCDRIKADTNGEIEPWNPNAKYGDELNTALQCMTYGEIFAGLENYNWYSDLLAGKAAFTGHMEPYVQVIQTLIDHDILREEHFSYSATTRGQEFAAGKIAMINMSIYDADNDEFDFGYMPFPTTQGELGYLCSKYSCFVGLPVKERSEKETEAVRRFIEYFSSPEGQATYIGNSIKVSNVKGVALGSGEGDLTALQPALDEGHQFTLLSFYDPVSGVSRSYLYLLAKEMTIEGKTGTQCLADVDSLMAAPAEEKPQETPEVIAAVENDMTILETSFCIADAYRNTMGADIGLIANNEVFRGNAMRLFAGDVTTDMVTVFKPRSFANDSALVKASMTGQQILDALNNPVGNDKTADCVYAYSGLKCTIAPWNEPGSRYVSVKLADGSELKADELYTVAFWAGTVADEYITQTLEAYEGTWEEMMTAQLRAGGTVTPADDKRIKLVWD